MASTSATVVGLASSSVVGSQVEAPADHRQASQDITSSSRLESQQIPNRAVITPKQPKRKSFWKRLFCCCLPLCSERKKTIPEVVLQSVSDQQIEESSHPSMSSEEDLKSDTNSVFLRHWSSSSLESLDSGFHNNSQREVKSPIDVSLDDSTDLLNITSTNESVLTEYSALEDSDSLLLRHWKSSSIESIDQHLTNESEVEIKTEVTAHPTDFETTKCVADIGPIQDSEDDYIELLSTTYSITSVLTEFSALEDSDSLLLRHWESSSIESIDKHLKSDTEVGVKSETSTHPTNYEFIESIAHITQTDGSQDYSEVLSITSSQFSDLSSDSNLEDSENSFWEHWNRSTQELSIHDNYEDSESDVQGSENVEEFDTSPKINFRSSCVAAPQHLTVRNNNDDQIKPSRESPELKEEWGQHIVKHMIESLAAHEGVPVTEIQTWVDSLQESESETEGIPDRASMKRFSFYALKMHFKSLLNNNTKNCNQTEQSFQTITASQPSKEEPIDRHIDVLESSLVKIETKACDTIDDDFDLVSSCSSISCWLSFAASGVYSNTFYCESDDWPPETTHKSNEDILSWIANIERTPKQRISNESQTIAPVMDQNQDIQENNFPVLNREVEDDEPFDLISMCSSISCWLSFTASGVHSTDEISDFEDE